MPEEKEPFILKYWPVIISIIGAMMVLISTISVGATLLYRFNMVETQQKEAKVTTELQYNQIIQKIEYVQASIGADKIAIELLKLEIQDNKVGLEKLKDRFDKNYLK